MEDKMSPDSVSLFPDRPIRPLPKRRLRERLAPEVADTIKYPPAPQNTAPLFYYPYNLKGESAAPGGEGSNFVKREDGADLTHDSSSLRNGLGGEHDGEAHSHQVRRTLVSRPLHEPLGHSTRTQQRSGQGRHTHPQPPPSTASSADGYDSFENTNNKKKRKIPTAGETILNGTHVLSDGGVLGIPSPPTTGDEGPGDSSGVAPAPYYQAGGCMANSKGISGPGRGRYGRNRQGGRSPLRQVPDTNVVLTERSSKMRPGGQYLASPRIENPGIISTAIASAEKLPIPSGQENISLLQQQATSKGSPATSQFTFTFDSQVPGTVSWPGSDPAPLHITRTSHGQQMATSSDYRDQYNGVNTGSTQTGPMSAHPNPSGTQAGTNGTADGGGKGATATANATQKKKRRNVSSLMRAARQRRQQTAYQNYQHPPAEEEIWICEFCEYQDIFGHPPEALIRQYEIKDRRRRREEAERRRLLEKAKMKSRKGKKANKLPAKNNVAQDRSAAPAGHQAPHMGTETSQEVQSEEFDEDDYYEEDVHDDHCHAAVHPSMTTGHHVDGGGGRSIGQDNRVPAA